MSLKSLMCSCRNCNCCKKFNELTRIKIGWSFICGCSELQINTNAFLQTQLNIAFAGSELEAYLETRRDFQILVQEFILNILSFKSLGIYFSAENKELLSSK